MKKNSLFFLLSNFLLMICWSPLQVCAQQSIREQKQNFWQRVSVGGNLGVQFGTVTAINVSPEAMVRAVDQLHVGVGFSYEYMLYRDYFYDRSTGNFLDFQSNVYGGRIFLRYYLRSLFDNFLGNIFAHTEYEYLYYTRPYYMVPYITPITDFYGNYYIQGNEAVEVNSLFVGAGYDQPLGGKVSMSFLILFNLNETFDSPYSNPIFRIGVGVGL